MKKLKFFESKAITGTEGGGASGSGMSFNDT